MTEKTADRGPLNDAVYSALGRITANASALEYSIVRLIGAMLKDPRLAYALTAGSTGRALLDVSSAVFRTRYRGHRFSDDFEALISSIRRLEARRNQIVHSWWDLDLLAGKVTRTRLKRDKKHPFVFDDESLDASELNEFADTLHLATKVVKRVPAALIKV